MPEFIIIVFPRVRDVFINGLRSGQTNELLTVGPGARDFSLGTPLDYFPDHKVEVVSETTDNDPLRITFELVA